MASVVGYLWLGIGVLGIIDAFRHSQSDWNYADRDRAFWVVFMFFFGPIFVSIYIFAVRRRFPRGDETSSQFYNR
jgi:tryptophan-rich sensory protein